MKKVTCGFKLFLHRLVRSDGEVVGFGGRPPAAFSRRAIKRIPSARSRYVPTLNLVKANEGAKTLRRKQSLL
ncbi:MAG: hypothetical protein LBG05_04370 [Treponema sp.]|nr:hypothetical protein [Treponema sp.]